jgi:glycine/D-amino acid oxidase-like deaminating enzyme
MEDGLRAAGTVEFGGLARAPSKKRADFLMRDVSRVFPRAQIPADWSFWMGHRPCFPDSLPVMGPSRHRGLWFNFGHGHLGLTMSASSGDILDSGAGDLRRTVKYRPDGFFVPAIQRSRVNVSAFRQSRPAARSCPSARPRC